MSDDRAEKTPLNLPGESCKPAYLFVQSPSKLVRVLLGEVCKI